MGVSFELAHSLFKRPHLADEFREQGLGGPDPPCLHGRPARSAAPHPARLDVAGHAGLRGYDGSRGHRDVIGDADLAGEDGAIADGARAGDTDLGDEDDVLPYLAVVSNLHEVVDLAPAPDEGVTEGCPVDGGVGPDLHVVLDTQPAHLGNLAMGAAIE